MQINDLKTNGIDKREVEIINKEHNQTGKRRGRVFCSKYFLI